MNYTLYMAVRDCDWDNLWYLSINIVLKTDFCCKLKKIVITFELYLKLQVASFFSTRNSNNTCLHVPNNHRGNRRHDSRRSTTHTGCHDTNLSRRSYVGQYKWHCESSRPISRCHHGSEFLGVIVHRSGHFREKFVNSLLEIIWCEMMCKWEIVFILLCFFG